jgi:hypothetical protein
MPDVAEFDKKAFDAFLDQDPDDTIPIFYYATGDEVDFPAKIERLAEIIRDEANQPRMRRYHAVYMVQALSDAALKNRKLTHSIMCLLDAMACVSTKVEGELHGRIATSTMRVLWALHKYGLLTRLAIYDSLPTVDDVNRRYDSKPCTLGHGPLVE